MNGLLRTISCILISFAMTAFILYLVAAPHADDPRDGDKAGAASSGAASGDEVASRLAQAGQYAGSRPLLDELSVMRCLGQADMRRAADIQNGQDLLDADCPL